MLCHPASSCSYFCLLLGIFSLPPLPSPTLQVLADMLLPQRYSPQPVSVFLYQTRLRPHATKPYAFMTDYTSLFTIRFFCGGVIIYSMLLFPVKLKDPWGIVTMSISYSVVYLEPATILGTYYTLSKYLLIECFGESIRRKQWYLVAYQDRKFRDISRATRSRNIKPGIKVTFSIFWNQMVSCLCYSCTRALSASFGTSHSLLIRDKSVLTPWELHYWLV